ncbi:M48 family metallopeptidase [Peptoniphilus ovalis]|nr:YgjP-like metallopeptidase domain-containing protein [Peptoniphilus ovalis]
MKIIKKKIKSIIIKVEDGEVVVSAPHGTSKSYIDKVLDKNKSRIEELKTLDAKKNRFKNHLFGEKIEVDNEKDLEKIYRTRLKAVLDILFEKYEKITGLKATSVNIRKMKVRWGTCYPASGKININLKLAERPIDEIEAVVLHELVHLKYGNHDKKFYNECIKYMPNYLEIEKRLKT